MLYILGIPLVKSADWHSYVRDIMPIFVGNSDPALLGCHLTTSTPSFYWIMVINWAAAFPRASCCLEKESQLTRAGFYPPVMPE